MSDDTVRAGWPALVVGFVACATIACGAEESNANSGSEMALGGAQNGPETGAGGSLGSPRPDGFASPGVCVDASGAGEPPWFDLTLSGTAFDADDGSRLRIVTATQSGNRVGVAEVPVVRGAFSVTMPQVLNEGWYVGVTLYIDRNANGTCETDEHVWNWTTGIVQSDLLYEVTPERACNTTLDYCVQWGPTQAACQVGSDTDLTGSSPSCP